MKLTIRAELENAELGAQFDIELPPKYANVVSKYAEIFRVVTEAVEQIKDELKKDSGDGRD
jgi:hypothetical protein